MSLLRQAFSLVPALLLAAVCHADLCDEANPERCRIEIPLHKSVLKRTAEAVTRISIADPEIADYHLVTPTQILLIAKSRVGTTNLIVWHGQERAEVYEVAVYVSEHFLEVLQSQVLELVPEARIRTLRSPTGGIIVDGEVESQEMLERILQVVGTSVDTFTNLVTVRGVQQVQLEVKVAEVSRSGMKKMGLGFLNNSEWSVGVFPAGDVSGTLDTTSGSNLGTTVSGIIDPTTGAVSANISSGAESKSLDSSLEIASPFASAFQVAVHSLSGDTLALLGILKGQGLARLLARPTLVTMSGQQAEFLVGGEFPVPVTAEEGETHIEFKAFGVMLRFTPTVVGRETITLQVEPEVSNPDFSLAVASGGVAVPGIKTRRGSATLQLKDGQTFVMAGLLKEEVGTVVNKLPFLGDIPILGTLFTSKQFQKSETELVIIVTPRLVRALNRDEVPPLPGQDLNDNVSDVDFFLLNKLGSERRAAEAGKQPTPESPEAETDALPGAATPEGSDSDCDQGDVDEDGAALDATGAPQALATGIESAGHGEQGNHEPPPSSGSLPGNGEGGTAGPSETPRKAAAPTDMVGGMGFAR
jgi:pilus assembly protein CpaC